MTKLVEVYTRFVDTFDKILVDEDDNDWEQELKNWISVAKKDESIFSEIDLKSWNELVKELSNIVATKFIHPVYNFLDP